MKRAYVAAILAHGLFAGSLSSQSPANVRRIAMGEHEAALGSMGTYARYYYRGLYDSLANAIRKNLKATQYREGKSPSWKEDYAMVAFVATPPADTAGTVVHVLLPPKGPAIRTPYRLPGVKSVYEVFITLDPRSQFETSWISTREAPPQQAQLIKLAETAFSPLASIIESGVLLFHMPDERAAKHYVFIGLVELPDERSTIKITSRVVNGIPVATKTVVDAVAVARAELATGTARIAPCALALNTVLADLLGNGQWKSEPLVLTAGRETLRRAVISRVGDHLLSSECTTDALSQNAEARANAVSAVASRYVSIVASPAKPVVGTADVRNVPSQRVSFGLIGGAMLSRSGDQNFELSDNVIQPKDLTGVITAAVVHLHPIAFDPSRPDLSAAERFSLFGGIVATPSAGFTAGISLRMFRGLGVQGSHAWLRANRLKPEYALGDAPAAGSSPFKLGFTHSYTIGISYEFK